MAWYDDFPGSGPLLGGAFNDPYGGTAAPALPAFGNFGGASPIADLYGGGAVGGGFANPLAGLYQNYTPAPMSSYPLMQTLAFQAAQPRDYQPFAQTPFSFQSLSQGFGGGQSFGGLGGTQGLGGYPGLGGGQQSLGGGLGGSSLGGGQMGGYSPSAQRGRMQSGAGQMPQGIGTGTMGGGQAGGYSGGTSNPGNLGGGAGAAGASGFVSPVPDGGVYGAQKWSSPMGSNAVDIFVPRGTPVRAPVSGTLQPGQNGQLILIGDNGLSFAFRHGMTTAQGHVQAGQQIGIVNDPGLDSLGRAPWGNMPDNYQHLEMSVSRGNYFPATPGGGGSVDAAQWLDSIGYRGSKISKTPGPPDAQGGGMGGFGGPPGMGMGGFPGMGGSPMGMGMPGQMGGNPFMSMMGQGSPFGMGQQNPFGSMMGFPGGGGSSFGGGQSFGGYGGFGF